MAARHLISRVRRETRRRTLTVASVEPRGDILLRIWFVGDDLAGFVSDAPDDHVKLFLPDGEGGVVARDYTPRRFDAAAQTLAIEFALHGEDEDAGPATRWAMHAQPGDTVEIGGPRGSTIVADDFDWYLLIGDETALPAIGRRLDELRPEAEVIVLASIAHGSIRPELPVRPRVMVQWLDRTPLRNAGAEFRDALDAMTLPDGEGFVWIAAEAAAARAVRTFVAETRGHPKSWIKASGYWVAGEMGAHTKIEE